MCNQYLEMRLDQTKKGAKPMHVNLPYYLALISCQSDCILKVRFRNALGKYMR